MEAELSDLIPTACASLFKQTYPKGAPFTYWFFGSDALRVLQDEESGKPVYTYAKNGESFPAKKRPYWELWPNLSSRPLGEDGPLTLYGEAGGQALLHTVLRPSSAAGGGPVRVMPINPDADGYPGEVSEPGELVTAQVSASTVTAACGLENSSAIVLFGNDGSGSVYWRWDLRLQKVSKPKPVPETVKGQVTAGFLGYDKVTAGASKVPRRISRLYAGAVEQPFVLTDTGTDVQFTACEAQPFLKPLSEHVNQSP
ncbi:hypothetical protein ACFVUW_11750 [Streptomyces xiamenensis]|uniref:hypothetical protein n=1 Tax=Streptomyces xiamenensis TaxID=408015 RepID=UPI0036E37DC5